MIIMSTCEMFLIYLSLLLMGRVGAQQKTGLLYEEPSEIIKTLQGQRSSWDHARVGRDIPGGGVIIETLPDNMTRLVEDSGRYYSWRSFGQEDSRTRELWVDMSDPNRAEVRMHGILSNTHRQAAKVALSFDFPFYGHYLRQIVIATGGFIFMGEVTHRMLTATQYVAPLMANFDPSYSKDSTVQYLDNGEVFVVQWERVPLQGRESEGTFTFQAALHRTGTITFSYRDIPMSMDVISTPDHPVSAGLSDAFMVLESSLQSPDTQQRTIYEYHRVEMDTTKITNHSAFEITPLPTCLTYDSCERCVSFGLTSGCTWCNVLQRCSDGMDRHRQEWLDYSCSESRDVVCEEFSRGGPDSPRDPSGPSESGVTTHLCPLPGRSESEDDTKRVVKYNGKDVKTGPRQLEGSAHTGVVAGVVAAVVLLLALTLLALYINSHPTSASQLCLIQQRNKCWPSIMFRKQALHSTYTEAEFESREKDAIVEAVQC